MNKPIHYMTNRFKKYRADRAWSRKQMADFLSLSLNRPLSVSTIQKWEDRRLGVKADVALEVAKHLKIDVMELVTRKDSE